MATYDAVVAGAGPAGSTAARLLAERGASVLLLDKQRFPRDKPCGGGVTLRAAAVQDIDLSPVIERTIYGARFSLRLGESFDRTYAKPLTYMTQRCRLDAHLAEKAAGAGAEFHDGESMRSVQADGLAGEQTSPSARPEALEGPRGATTPRSPKRPKPTPITIGTSHSTYNARVLIGADGANGVTARAAGLNPHSEEAVALEGNLPFSPDIPEDWREYVGIDLGGLAGGYGWVFPKSEHLNTGVGAWKYATFTLRPKLTQLCIRYGFDASRLENLRGHHLPLRTAHSPIAIGPIALVGDAAGLIDPLSGEGIHMAFASGRLAADHTLRYLAGETASMAGYERAVDAEVQPELDISRRLQELFHFAPPPYLALMRRSEKFWLFFCHLIRGELTYLDFVRMIGPLRVALDFFADVAQRRREARVSALVPLLRGL
ncbi:MAG: NAD(P)/FAD-dependent oxidoreductase [Chloroflexi bacterium]|nr:MAG: NAD(P)/FAD-dependent oxidoreductase [Chloroflexota bacterium]